MNITNKKRAMFVGLAIFLLHACVPHAVSAYTLYSPFGFLEMLLERGIVAQEKSDKARELLSMIQAIDAVRTPPNGRSVPNANRVSISASQYIQHGDLQYTQSEDIAGLILLVQNDTSDSIILEAKRGCHITYAIYDENEVLVYNSADTEVCQTVERVTYLLNGNASRMFEVTHSHDEYALSPGIYDIVLTYEGYGKGKRTVSVQP